MASSVADVANQLRSAVIEGRLRPGSRLPNRQALSRMLGASLATVQEAVAVLRQEGFVEVGARKHGTRVSLRPPHEFSFKIVFPEVPPFKGTFYRHLYHEAMRINGGRADFSCLFGLGDLRDPAPYHEILEDVRRERIAGLIFASSADEFLGTELLKREGVPRAAVAESYQLPNIPKIRQDYVSFFARAIERLVAAGRKKLAFLVDRTLDIESTTMKRLHAATQEHGIAINPIWLQSVDASGGASTRHLTHLIFHPGQKERPDGLIVADDNCLPSVIAGLEDAGVTCGEDVEVVAIANFPLEDEVANLPVTHLGFDVAGMLEVLTNLIIDQRRGREVPMCQAIPAMFDFEYEASTSLVHPRNVRPPTAAH